MKKFLLALLFVVNVAHAEEEWWETPNTSGGKIVLLNSPCNNRTEQTTLKRMFAAHREGLTIWGCWNFWSGQVHVIYDDGKTYTYDPAGFVRKTAP